MRWVKNHFSNASLDTWSSIAHTYSDGSGAWNSGFRILTGPYEVNFAKFEMFSKWKVQKELCITFKNHQIWLNFGGQNEEKPYGSCLQPILIFGLGFGYPNPIHHYYSTFRLVIVNFGTKCYYVTCLSCYWWISSLYVWRTSSVPLSLILNSNDGGKNDSVPSCFFFVEPAAKVHWVPK